MLQGSHIDSDVIDTMAMTAPRTANDNTGFSDVDRSGRSDALVEYLRVLARAVDQAREIGYAQLCIREGSHILDVGCGAGEVCIELARRVGPRGRVVGVDVSADMIEQARCAADGAGAAVELHVGSILALPFLDSTFDAVRAERVLQHLDDPDAALRELVRVTRPGGRIQVSDPDHGQATLAFDEVAHRQTFEKLRTVFLGMAKNPHSGSRLRPMFARAELVDIEHATTAIALEFPVFRIVFLLESVYAKAIAGGALTAGEARAFTEVLEARHRAGSFYACAINHSVGGTKH